MKEVFLITFVAGYIEQEENSDMVREGYCSGVWEIKGSQAVRSEEGTQSGRRRCVPWLSTCAVVLVRAVRYGEKGWQLDKVERVAPSDSE